MNLIYALAISVVAGCGIYLLLSHHVVRMILGISIFSAATNLIIFFAGRLGAEDPPIIEAGKEALSTGSANPLPQALVLTAIVIGFALITFAVSLALQAYRSIGSLNILGLNAAERLGSPFRPVDKEDDV